MYIFGKKKKKKKNTYIYKINCEKTFFIIF